jgi:hypothetical protein
MYICISNPEIEALTNIVCPCQRNEFNTGVNDKINVKAV